MLMPKRVKRRKQFRGSMAGKASRGNTLAYGEFGLVATEPCWIKSNQIEAARIALTRYTKRTGKVWIKIFPDKPVTVKPLGTRMGSGKGAVDCWVAVVKPGRVMFEIAGVPEEDARRSRWRGSCRRICGRIWRDPSQCRLPERTACPVPQQRSQVGSSSVSFFHFLISALLFSTQ